MNIPYVMKKCSKCGEWLVASSVNFSKGKTNKYGLKGWCKECSKEYHKKYRETHKEAIAERGRRWRETNKEHRAEYCRQYQQENKEAIAEQRRQYYQDNKEAIAEQQRQYYESNKEAKAEYQRRYRERNKEAIAERRKQRYEQNKEIILEQCKKYRETHKEAKAEYNKQYKQSPKGQVIAFNSDIRRRAKEQAQGNGITVEQWKECMSFFNWQCAYSGITLSKETRSLDHIEPINKGGVNEIWNVVPMYRAYNSRKQDKDMLEWYTEQPYFSQDRLDKIYKWQEYAFNKWGIDTEAQ